MPIEACPWSRAHGTVPMAPHQRGHTHEPMHMAPYMLVLAWPLVWPLALAAGSGRWLSPLALPAGSPRWLSPLALPAGSRRWLSPYGLKFGKNFLWRPGYGSMGMDGAMGGFDSQIQILNVESRFPISNPGCQSRNASSRSWISFVGSQFRSLEKLSPTFGSQFQIPNLGSQS